MATLDAASLVGDLKVTYTDEDIEFLQNNDEKLWGMLPEGTEQIGGSGLQIPFILSANNAITSTGTSAGPIQAAGTPNMVQSTLLPVRTNVPITIDNFLPVITKDRNMAFKEALDLYITTTIKEFGANRNRMLYGTGSGVIGTIPTGAASATQTLSLTLDNIYWLRIGMVIDIYDSTLVTNKGTRTVTNINFATGAVTLNSTITTANLDVIVRSGIVPSYTPNGSMSPGTGVMKEINGLKAIIGNASDIASLQGLSRTTYPQLNAQVFDAGQGSVTLDMIQKMINRSEIAQGSEGGGVDLLISSYGQVRKIAEAVLPQIRYASGSGIDGGVERDNLKALGLNFLIERAVNTGTIYGMKKGTVKKYIVEKQGFRTTKEGISYVSNAVPGGADSQSALFCDAVNLGTNSPAVNFRITNLLEPNY